MNRLFKEKAPYLRHAAHQKIDWYPWSEEAFDRARREDKPIFMSSGAVWCHWCHVMAKESFQDERIVKLLNENFINIKLDRDERPDIDRLYQNAASAMGVGGGWPLSIFLTPDSKPFFAGTYFPPEDSLGRPGFRKILMAVNDIYKSKRQEVSSFSDKLLNALKHVPLLPGEINENQINNAVINILSKADLDNGGFGSAPKFPMTGTVEFLINRYVLSQNESVYYAVKKTLDSMAKGGFCDQLGGGFHRYSTDDLWIVPHFEKMADDNAWLLRNYVDAYAVSGDERYRQTVEGIIRFISDVLSDKEGGFYASQDADVTPDDEGGYFTWTDEDFKKALSDEEYKVLSLYLSDERGAMHHDPSKRVLFAVMEPEEIAEKLNSDKNAVNDIIRRGKEKLLNERNKRKTPFVDKTLYTSLNGMLISAYLKADRIICKQGLRDFALKSLERITGTNLVGNKLYHSEGVRALLEDYIHLIDALIYAYETTGNDSFLEKADMLMELCMAGFWDKNEGGFFDTDEQLMDIRLKRIEDFSHPSAISLGIILLLKLHYITGKTDYHKNAEKALKAFSVSAAGSGILSGYYYSALDAYFNMIKLIMQTAPSSGLASAVLSSFRPYISIVYEDDKGRVIPCLKDRCFEPVINADDFMDFYKKNIDLKR